MHTDFRFALKAGAQAQHDSVDSLFSRLDFQHYDDYVRFLALQAQGFGVLREQADAQCLTARLLHQMCAALATDLEALGQALGVRASPDLGLRHRPDPIAIDYVVAGSRLGAQVLARRWAGSKDQRVRSAGSYLGLPTDASLWRAVCAGLSEIDPDSDRAKQVQNDVCAIFDLFVVIGHDQGAEQTRGVFAQ